MNYKEMFKEFIKNGLIDSYILYLKEEKHLIQENGISHNSELLKELRVLKEDISLMESISIIDETIEKTLNQKLLNQKYSNTLLNILFVDERENVPFSSKSLDYHNIKFSLFKELVDYKKKSILNYKISNEDIEFISEKVLNYSTFDNELKQNIVDKKIDSDKDAFEIMLDEFVKKSNTIEYDAILNNNGIDQSIECGWMWQINSFLDKESYRELRLTLESKKESDYVQLILGDDILSYDGCSSEENQYYKVYNKDCNGLITLFNEIELIANNINKNVKKSEDFQLFERNLIELKLEKR